MIELVIDGDAYTALQAHLFQPDRDEHAAVVLAGVHRNDTDLRLLAREVHLVSAESFPPGVHGYRQTDSRTVAKLASRAGEQKLAYVALHSHPGSSTTTSLSGPDRDAHGRLFPHLHDLIGAPVAGMALGISSADGEVWIPGAVPATIDRVRVLDSNLLNLTARPAVPRRVGPRHDRQARMFGDAGQERLRASKVAVIGAGGGGSIIAQQLAHLGVGTITLVDHDTVGPENLSRIVGAVEQDARRQRKKVDVLAELVARVDHAGTVNAIDGDVTDLGIAERLLGCDFIFLATDTISSRLVFNAIVHRYLIPGVQIGAKVEVDPHGRVEEIYVAVRPVWPHTGCLECNGLISPEALQREQRTGEEARAQNYVGEPEVIDPSVITLNGIAASHAVTLFLLSLTGLAEPGSLRHRLYFPARGETLEVKPKRRDSCSFCAEHDNSMRGRGGDPAQLPVKRLPAAGPARRRRWSWRRLLARGA